MKQRSEGKHRTVAVLCMAAIVCVLCIFALIWDALLLRCVDEAQSSLLAVAYGEEIERPRINFPALKEINPDVCGWICIEGTNIDFPILRGEDNELYLNTDFYGKQSFMGSIFMDYRCAADFSDDFTLIYGHNVKGGRMFADLCKFKDQSFFDAHPYAVLELPDEEEPILLHLAAVLSIPADDPDIFGFEQTVTAALLLEKAYIAKREILENSSHFIAFSTCSYAYKGERCVIIYVAYPA